MKPAGPKAEKQPAKKTAPEPDSEAPDLQNTAGAPAGLPLFLGGEAPGGALAPVFTLALPPGASPGIQAKLTVGAADDPLEAEADRMAEQVTAAPVYSTSRTRSLLTCNRPVTSNLVAPPGASMLPSE